MATESVYPHAGHRKRLREKFLTGGAEALSETELLELLLFFSVPRIDTRPLAETLLTAFGSIDGVLAACPEELHTLASLPNGTDALFALIRHLCERAKRDLEEDRFGASGFSKDYLIRQFSGFRKERTILFYLDAQGGILQRQTVMSNECGAVRLCVGSYAGKAKQLGAAAMIFAHNHPNGRAVPSGADLDATGRLYRFLKQKDIVLLEHYIVAGGECYPILACNGYLRSAGLQDEEATSVDSLELR